MALPHDGTQARANLEIKAHCADLAAAREKAERLATSHLGVEGQVDTYFRVPEGRLKLRECTPGGAVLIPYLRPNHAGTRRSDYQVIPIEDPGGLRRLLSAILGVHRIVRKEREIFLVENVRIHLDRVEELGDFIELEAVFDGSAARESEQHALVAHLMSELGIAEGELLGSSYEALIAGAAS